MKGGVKFVVKVIDSDNKEYDCPLIMIIIVLICMASGILIPLIYGGIIHHSGLGYTVAIVNLFASLFGCLSVHLFSAKGKDKYFTYPIGIIMCLVMLCGCTFIFIPIAMILSVFAMSSF